MVGREKDSRLSLLELNELVEQTLKLQLCRRYWVVGEIASLREAANGHCYMELVQRDERKGLVAKASAHVWRGTYAFVSSHFERQTGMALGDGLKVLVEVEVDFHALYGYSLNVTDIDASYTLGDMVQRRQEIIARLASDGVLDLNKQLQLAVPSLKIAVVSSASAAGYGDFCKQLVESRYAFEVKLFSSIMQGAGVEDGIISALNAIYEEVASGVCAWDVVVIIRGGGATSDLSGFDAYMLAANVAQYPLPVLTGIGHDRDATVLDVVAFKALKTPTAVAAYLVDCVGELYNKVCLLEERLTETVTRKMVERRNGYQLLAHRFATATAHFAQREEERLNLWNLRLNSWVHSALSNKKMVVQRLEDAMGRSVEAYFQRQEAKLEQSEASIRMASPERILKMGYSMTEVGGQVVSSVKQLKRGQRMVTYLSDGKVESEVL